MKITLRILVAAAITCISIESFSQAFYGVTPSGGSSGGGTIFRANLDGTGLRAEASFLVESNPGTMGDYGVMIQVGSKLYGVQPQGGITNQGVLYEYDPVNNIYNSLADFNFNSGLSPIGTLAVGPNGSLYGTCSGGGANGSGTIFEYNINTDVLTKRWDFTRTVDGNVPWGGLTLVGSKFYGVAAYGGVNDNGTIYEFDPSTNVVTLKHFFTGSGASGTGAGSFRQMILVNGKLYGLTLSGGLNGKGTIFEYDPTVAASASNPSKKFDFGGANGETPIGAFTLASNGKLYASTAGGGANNVGIIFEYTPGATTILKRKDFAGTDGNGNIHVFTEASGKLYGTSEYGGAGWVLNGAQGEGVIFSLDLTSFNYVKIRDFVGANGLGSTPKSGMIKHTNGKLYGTVAYGGSGGTGGIFEFNPTGDVYNLRISLNLSLGGIRPQSSTMVQTPDGMLYGSTNRGGTLGAGTIFKFNPVTKELTRAADFNNYVTKGANPIGGLSLHPNGFIYGTAYDGGANNKGVIYRYDPTTSNIAVMLSFATAAYGERPQGALMLASNGRYYAMTEGGGTDGYGTIVEYNVGTGVSTKKVDFKGATNGANPVGTLVEVGGKAYGLTILGGGTSNSGCLFEYDFNTTITKRVTFDNATQTGGYPVGSLYAVGTKLYGSTATGVIFSFETTNNQFTPIHTLTYDQGSSPNGEFRQGAAANLLYTTTPNGGANQYGTIIELNTTTGVVTKKSDFSAATGIGPLYGGLTTVSNAPPKILSVTPSSAAAGAVVTVAGENFSSNPAANVVYFGTAKAVVNTTSSGMLEVVVPKGATYAPVSVTVAGRTAYSPKPFNLTYTFNKWVPGSFTSRYNIPEGAAAKKKAAVGDFDNDGLLDAAIANGGDKSISIFRNLSNGTNLSYENEKKFLLDVDTYTIKVADVDGDGNLDIVATTYGLAGVGVAILRNTSTAGNINFATRVHLTGPVNTSSIAVADLDADGKPEIITGGESTNIYVYKNNSTSGTITAGSFSAAVTFDAQMTGVTPNIWGLAIGDINGDSKPDIVATAPESAYPGIENPVNGNVVVFANVTPNGVINTSSFSAPVKFEASNYRSGLVLSDLDGDGKLDMISSGFSDPPIIYIWRNTTTSTTIDASAFAAPVLYQIPGDGSWNIDVGNVDGDDKPDLIAQTINEHGLLILSNACTPGNISASTFIPGSIITGNRPLNAIVADMNNDNLPDIVIGDEEANTVSVLTNRNGSPPPTIASVAPESAPVGASVTITGTNFDATVAGNNVVYFGPVKGEVTAATATTLTVKVPAGKTYSYITVQVGGLTASSPKKFSGSFTTSGSLSTTSFVKAPDAPTGTNPQIFTFADVDVNGKTEVVVANQNVGTISVLNNTSIAGAVALAKVDFASGTQPYGIASGDLDGDGLLDIVTANMNANSISLFKNKSTGVAVSASTFAAQVDIGAPTLPFSVAIADLDLDGKQDIVVTGRTDAKYSVYHNRTQRGDAAFTSASFVRVDFDAYPNPSHVAIHDLDGDKRPELIIPSFDGDKVYIYKNICVPGSHYASFYNISELEVGGQPYATTVADYNGDGKPEIAVTNNSGGKIAVFSNGTGVGTDLTFAPRVDFTVNTGVNLITSADVDGDKKIDIVAISAGNINVLRNLGVPTDINPNSFAPSVNFAANNDLISVGVADIDGDGKPDLLASSASANAISVFRNNNTMAPPTANAATAIAATTFTANWTAPAGASTYRLDVSADNFATILTGYDNLLVDGTSQIVSGLTVNTAYKYRVRAENVTGASANSNEISVTTQPAAPLHTISNVNPTSGAVGTPVTITGTNFSTTPANNIVKFANDVTATVTSSTATSIVTSVPTGAVTGKVSVTISGTTVQSTNDFTVSPATLQVTSTETTVELGAPYEVKATLNVSAGVNSVKVNYRRLSGTGTSFTEADMVLSAGTYTKTLTAAEIGELGFEYTVSATTTSGNPTSPSKTVMVKVSLNGLTIPYTAAGTGQVNYRIIATPVVSTPNTVTAILEDDLGVSTRKNWRVSHFNGSTNTELTSGSNIVPGQGYWLIATTAPAGGIDTGPGTMVEAGLQGVSISVTAGWNQLGNPYNYNIVWQDVINANSAAGLTAASVRGYEGNWTAPTTISKMTGFFVRMNAAGTIRIPPAKNPSAGRPHEEIPENILVQPNWNLALKVICGDQVNQISGIGMHRQASDSYDIHDGFTMPRFFERYLELNHRKSDRGDAYSLDVVPRSDYHVWEFDIESNEAAELAKIEWDNEHFGDNNMTLILWDVARSRGVDMRESNSYQFEKSTSGAFRLYYGEKNVLAKEVVVAQSVLHEVSPNPTPGVVTAAFSIPSEGNVQFEVIDMLGRIQWTAEKVFGKGYHEQPLTNLEGRGGMYIIQMKYGEERRQKRLIVR